MTLPQSILSGSFLAADAGGGPESMMLFLLLPIMLVVFFIFSRRSQKRQQAEHQKMVESLESGAKVMLSSGMIGLVDKVDKDNQEVRVLIDEDKRVHARFNWGAVTKVFTEKVENVAAKEKA